MAGDTNMGATFTACYATDRVSGSGTGIIHVGGVTGENIDDAPVACCHVTRAVGGPDGTTGGVTGQNYTDSHVGRRHPDRLLLGEQSGKRHRQQSVRHSRRNHPGGWTDAMGTMTLLAECRLGVAVRTHRSVSCIEETINRRTGFRFRPQPEPWHGEILSRKIGPTNRIVNPSQQIDRQETGKAGSEFVNSSVYRRLYDLQPPFVRLSLLLRWIRQKKDRL